MSTRKSSSNGSTKKTTTKGKPTTPTKKSNSKSDKSNPKPVVKRRERLPVPPPKKRRIVEILSNDDILGEIEDLAATGASLATIDAKMKWPPNTMSIMLSKGKERKTGPYRKFYILFRSWVAEARHIAEATMAKKTPEKWLDRNSSAKTIETEEDRSLIQQSNTSQGVPGLEAAKVLAALKILRTQGISIDEAFDQDDISLLPEEPK